MGVGLTWWVRVEEGGGRVRFLRRDSLAVADEEAERLRASPGAGGAAAPREVTGFVTTSPEVEIFVAGASVKDCGAGGASAESGGAGAAVVWAGGRAEGFGLPAPGDSLERATLRAGILALESLADAPTLVTVHTSLRYLLDRAQGRVPTEGNHDLWRRLRALAGPHRLRWRLMPRDGRESPHLAEAAERAAREAQAARPPEVTIYLACETAAGASGAGAVIFTARRGRELSLPLGDLGAEEAELAAAAAALGALPAPSRVTLRAASRTLTERGLMEAASKHLLRWRPFRGRQAGEEHLSRARALARAACGR